MGSDFSAVTGTGSLGVLVVAEASGEHEAREQRPLVEYAPSGSLLERTFKRMGLSRQQFSLTNCLRCFISPRTSVFTSEGYRDLCKIKSGDLILTHKGRFLPTSGVLHQLGKVPYLTIQIRGKAWSKNGVKEQPTFIRVTPDHRFMTEQGWKFASELTSTSRITALAEHCVECGSKFHRSFRLTLHGSLPFCSIKCHNIFVARRAVDKLREVMLESYRSGQRDSRTVAKAAQAAMRKLLESGWRTPITEEGRKRGRMGAALTRQALGLVKEGGWIGKGEHALAGTLEAAGYDFIPQYALAGYNFDFRVGNTLIEVDGPCSQQRYRKMIQFLKESEAEKAGLKVIHVPHDNPIVALNLLENDSHDYEFMDIQVVSVEGGKTWPYGWWSIAVPEDESFVAQGVVNHNCRPKNDWLEKAPWEYEALRHCRPNLDAVISQRRPRAILALGGIALRELTGMAGDAQGISHLAGYALRGPNDIPTIGAFHPAYIRRGKASHQGLFSRNLQRAVNIAAGKDRSWIWDIEGAKANGDINYATHPSLEEARSFVLMVEQNSALTLSYDIETFESASLDEDARDGFSDTQIRLVQFSTGAGKGIAFPWDGSYRGLAQRLLLGSNVKCGHNLWLFDNKVLDACGQREGLDLRPRGVIHDTLQMFHHWQPDLPAHLQFCAQFVQFPFPWKHLAGTDLEFYGCVDVDATLRLYEMLKTTMQRDGIWGGREYGAQRLDGLGSVSNIAGGSSTAAGNDSKLPNRWDALGYLGQVLAVRPVLAAMEDRGLPVDDAERLKLDGEFDLAQQELDTEIQGRVPQEICNIEPRRGKKGSYSYGYINAPKCTDGLHEREFREAGMDGNGEPSTIHVRRWCRVIPFNPNSGLQLIEYMRAKGHKIPKSRKSENADGSPKDTTEKKELIRLANRHGDDFYLKVIEYRELGKMRGTYIGGFVPHVDGCVHTTFTFDTGIGQLSSRNPNIQNFPKHGRLAKATRRMIAAKPGNILVEWDYKSCHVLTLGFLAEDASYIRCARIDMHSIVTGHKLGLWHALHMLRELTDDEIRAQCKMLKANPDWKHIRDARMKHAILGIGNGLKARGLYEKHMEDFSSQREAQEFLSVVEELFPKVFEWHKKVQKQAHEQQFLRTQYGHIRRFYEVFRWDQKRGGWGHGDQAEEAISYWLSNIAFGYIREHLKEVDRLGLAERYGLCNNVHDSLLFHFPESLMAEHVRDIYPVLIAPSKVLSHPTIAPDGLWIDVEANAGYNWASMNEVPLGEVAYASTAY